MENKFDERLNRLLTAVHLGKPDRIPTMGSGSAVFAALTNTKLSDYCADMNVNLETNLKGSNLFQPDGVQVTIFEPKMLDACWMGHMELPGVELPDNDLWQMHEKENIKEEDYDAILEKGFAPWYMQFLTERLHWDLSLLERFPMNMASAIATFAQNGYPCFCGSTYWTPIEMFCGGRTLARFFMDLVEDPDKVEAVFDATHAFFMETWETAFKSMPQRPIAAWVGGWRGTPDMISPEMFERFSWKYLKDVGNLLLKYNVIPLFHLDSNWTNGMKYFREFPKGSVILGLDGKTDIFKAKKIIGDHCCIMGDVSATLLSFGTPEEVDAYCERLIREVGPEGFILSSGCDVPYNGKYECIKALYDAPFKFPI